MKFYLITLSQRQYAIVKEKKAELNADSKSFLHVFLITLDNKLCLLFLRIQVILHR